MAGSAPRPRGCELGPDAYARQPTNQKRFNTRLESRRLSTLCRVDPPVVRAYYLKEVFQRFWDCRHPGWAKPCLQQWL